MMRNILVFIVILSALACSQPVTESISPGTMAGVYTLQSRSGKTGNRDTSFPAENQVKIFTDKYYIYGAIAPDSTALFGFGSYVLTDSTMLEKNIFNSSTLDSASETKMKISGSPSTFTQIRYGLMMHGLAYEVSETFKKIPDPKKSVLDGTWEQVSFENITGTDTTIIKNRQYMIYQGGHFMWVHSYLSDPSNKNFQAGYGFGVFSIKDKTITETIIASNYKEIIEAPLTVSFSLKNNNQLVLVFSEENSVTTETYRRLN